MDIIHSFVLPRRMMSVLTTILQVWLLCRTSLILFIECLDLFGNLLAVVIFHENLILNILVGDGVWLNYLVLNLEILFGIVLTTIQININRLLVEHFVFLKLILNLGNFIQFSEHFLVQKRGSILRFYHGLAILIEQWLLGVLL